MKKKLLLNKKKLAFILIAVVFIGLLAVRIYNTRRFYAEKQTRFMMDTYVTIYAIGSREVSSRAVQLALDRMQEIDVKFNPLNPKSPLYAFNRQGIPISEEEIINVARLALMVSQESGGAFDITGFPLSELWGFSRFSSKSGYLPSQEEIRSALKYVGYQHLILDDGKLTKNEPGVAVDLGGIAKGYSVSQAVRVLKANGVASALIDAGGDVYALGKKGNRFWNIGIRSPRGEELLGYLEVEDLAVMSSGDYEKFFIKDGKRYHHIFNPKTGYPAEGVSGVTVIHPDPMMADAWATALFVMGPEEGIEIAEKIPNMETIIVTTSGEILRSSGLRNILKAVPRSK